VVILSFILRESDIQYVDANNLFHTPGIYYRPNTLKTMSCLLGNTESRIVYKNFNLENLNSNAHDESHYNYQKYLQYNKFLPQNDNNYFIHTALNIKPNPASTEEDKGWFNIFPLDLMSITDELKIPSTNLGKLLREYFGKGLYIVKKTFFNFRYRINISFEIRT
jgi:hypothetical protein